MKKCVMSGCGAQGEPQNGEDFFICDDCCDALESVCDELLSARAAEVNQLLGVQ